MSHRYTNLLAAWDRGLRQAQQSPKRKQMDRGNKVKIFPLKIHLSLVRLCKRKGKVKVYS